MESNSNSTNNWVCPRCLNIDNNIILDPICTECQWCPGDPIQETPSEEQMRPVRLKMKNDKWEELNNSNLDLRVKGECIICAAEYTEEECVIMDCCMKPCHKSCAEKWLLDNKLGGIPRCQVCNTEIKDYEVIEESRPRRHRRRNATFTSSLFLLNRAAEAMNNLNRYQNNSLIVSSNDFINNTNVTNRVNNRYNNNINYTDNPFYNYSRNNRLSINIPSTSPISGNRTLIQELFSDDLFNQTNEQSGEQNSHISLNTNLLTTNEIGTDEERERLLSNTNPFDSIFERLESNNQSNRQTNEESERNRDILLNNIANNLIRDFLSSTLQREETSNTEENDSDMSISSYEETDEENDISYLSFDDEDL